MRDPEKRRASARRANRKYYLAHKEELRPKRKVWRAAWRKENQEKVREYRARYKANHPGRRISTYYANNRVKVLEAAKDRNALLRKEMLFAYGDRCVCCAEDEPAFLTLDHYGEDKGIPMRKDKNKYAQNYRGAAEYRRLKRLGWPQDGFRLLCMNCNWATRWKKVCPHVKPAT